MFIIYDVLQSWNVWWHSQRFWCTTPSRPFPICDWMHSIICFNLSQGDSGATGPQGLPGAPGKTVQYEFFCYHFSPYNLCRSRSGIFVYLYLSLKYSFISISLEIKHCNMLKIIMVKRLVFFFCWILQQHILTNFDTFTRNS